jgi:hypothetical protein
MSGLLWRDDRGSMDTSSMTGAMFLGLAVIVPCLVFVGPRSGWLVVLVVVGGAVVATSVLAMGVVAAEKYWQRANRRLHDEMDPLLAEWLGKTKVGDDDLRDWRCARRAGITVAEAQRWSDHGMPFPLATSARKFRIDLPTVVALAGVLRDAGVWDGRSRGDIWMWLGSYLRDDCDYHPAPVLDRWVKFSPDQIRGAVLTTLGPPATRELTLDSAYEVLTALDPDQPIGQLA